jgi:hypothetical protein
MWSSGSLQYHDWTSVHTQHRSRIDEAGLVCTDIHQTSTLNHIEEAKDKSKEDRPIDINMYTMSDFDMGTYFIRIPRMLDICNTYSILSRQECIKHGMHYTEKGDLK